MVMNCPKGGMSFQLLVRNIRGEILYDYQKEKEKLIKYKQGEQIIVDSFPNCPELTEDINVEFFDGSVKKQLTKEKTIQILV
jgi:hypothetical protein